ncbi:MAG: acyl carrier protein [Synergistaceae bacterium]|nr:acyl carrier protein [Synergistaceae bacterium]
MNVPQFINEIADIIEADPRTLSLESNFRESADFWSSLVAFTLLTFLEDQYGATLSVEELIECQTLGDLYSKVSRVGDEAKKQMERDK